LYCLLDPSIARGCGRTDDSAKEKEKALDLPSDGLVDNGAAVGAVGGLGEQIRWDMQNLKEWKEQP